VVDRALDAKSHHELLTRSASLLVFCATCGTLNTKHLDSLWRRVMGENAYEAKIADDIIISLSHVMSLDECMYVVTQHMEKTAPRDFDVGLVDLIRQFTLYALQNQRRRDIDEKLQRWMGLPMLWKLWQVFIARRSQTSSSLSPAPSPLHPPFHSPCLTFLLLQSKNEEDVCNSALNAVCTLMKRWEHLQTIFV
jgi:hypothetical protein